MIKVYRNKTKKENIEIGLFITDEEGGRSSIGINLTDTKNKSEWVEFTSEEIRDIVELLSDFADEADDADGLDFSEKQELSEEIL